jgi:hypothetical protein
MYSFSELINRSTAFSLKTIEDIQSKVIDELEITGSTIAVKNLQMIQIHKSIISIGMFSLFESILQKGLKCQNGFEETKKILITSGKTDLNNLFIDFIYAINVLKHGTGRSYNHLIGKSNSLPFKIKLLDEDFFDGGDISEVATLIEVDDEFILNCAKLIEDISAEIRKERSDFFY